MIIIIKKDGTVITDDGNPVDIKALDNAALLLADPQDGNSIVYDASAGCWVAGEGGGSFSPDITNPQDGDTLVYNAEQQKWVNGAGGGGGGGVLKITLDDTTHALDKTWKEISDAFLAGQYCSIFRVEEGGLSSERVNGVGSEPSENYYAIATINRLAAYYSTDSENGYPVLAQP